MSLTESERICPLCGKDNNCMHDAAECWCSKIKISKQVLDMIPEDKKGKACVCKDCIEKYQEQDKEY